MKKDWVERDYRMYLYRWAHTDTQWGTGIASDDEADQKRDSEKEIDFDVFIM